jgi:hypothetical protein
MNVIKKEFSEFISNRSIRSRTRIQIRMGMLCMDADLDPAKCYRSDRIPIRNHNNGLIDDTIYLTNSSALCYPFFRCCRKDMRVTSAISRRMIDLCTAVPQPQPRPGSVHKEHPFNTGTVAYLTAVSRVVK